MLEHVCNNRDNLDIDDEKVSQYLIARQQELLDEMAKEPGTTKPSTKKRERIQKELEQIDTMLS